MLNCRNVMLREDARLTTLTTTMAGARTFKYATFTPIEQTSSVSTLLDH